jgi:hypothetical protein
MAFIDHLESVQWTAVVKQSLCLWGGSDAAADPIDYLDIFSVSK